MEPGQQCPGSFCFPEALYTFFKLCKRKNRSRCFCTKPAGLPYFCDKYSKFVSQPTGSLSNEDYINGLLQADPAVLETIYADFRLPMVKILTSLGSSSATGRSFFRAALVETAQHARSGTLPADVPFFNILKSFGLAHYFDWLTEREQPLPENTPDPEEPTFPLPDSDTLRATRAQIDAWKKGEQTQNAGFNLWEKIRFAENRLDEHSSPKSKNNLARNIFIAFVLITLGWIVWMFVFRAKTPAEVYDENFTLPKSLMEDMRHRYGPEMGNDSVSTRPSACEFYLTEADRFYQAKDYESATSVLAQILDDSLTLCHSDALLYIGIIALEEEKPELALECFSKIEDLEHFGEDIYWYQSLAFVKIAELNPLLRDKASRAVERARSNTRDSIRRVQAEKMLKHLAR